VPIAVRVDGSDAIRVSRVEPDATWDRYAEDHPRAALGHARGWREVFATAYAIDTQNLVAQDASGRPCGILALARFRSLSGGQSWVSLPFLDSAGVLADGPGPEAALLDAALALGGASELRQSGSLAALPTDASSRVEMILDLGGGPDARWRMLPAKVRNQTRKARKEGLTIAPPDSDAVGDFHRVHCRGMRELGSPPHSERFFRSVAEVFGDRARFVVVRAGARTVGGLVAIEFGGIVTIPWASTLASERARCPNNLAYWEAIHWAEELGARAFSFGRSPRGSGTHRFKRGWGAREQPLHWLARDARGEVRAPGSAGDSRVLSALSQVWKRLPPAFCDWCGPQVRRRIAS
jgi:FemAB-related protein (PEP-CTERM system-associated)